MIQNQKSEAQNLISDNSDIDMSFINYLRLSCPEAHSVTDSKT
jgi:hypothetical protein